MNKKRILAGLLALTLLSCNVLNRMLAAPTATPLPPTPTLTPTLTLTPTPTALQPAYIPAECAARPLATVPAEDALHTQATPEYSDNPEISKQEQLDIFTKLTGIVTGYYVYPNFNGRDWNGMQARYKAKIEAGLDTEAFYHEMRLMIEELGDEHSFFLSPAEVQEADARQRGDVKFTGIGIYGLTDYERQRQVVISTYAGSSANYARLQPHDAILQVDGLPITLELGLRIRGPECSVVRLTVQSPGGQPRDVMLVRHVIEGGLEIDARLVPTTDGSKIGYLFIPSFFDETLPAQVDDALRNFGHLDGLILDVRLNGGGSSSVVDPILSRFVSGKLGRFVSHSDSFPLTIQADPIANSQTVPLVVVVSRDTASYGEIFAGVLKDQGRAKVTGQTSLGNVEVLYGFDFEDGSQAWVASAVFRPAHSDANWEETGIIPDLPAYAEWDTFTFETDPSIAAALTLLGHR